jgi:hypothetical protein
VTDSGRDDGVHTERLHQQENDHAAQADQQRGEDRNETGRGGSLDRVADAAARRDGDPERA